jgi:hypothetical protein
LCYHFVLLLLLLLLLVVVVLGWRWLQHTNRPWCP